MVSRGCRPRRLRMSRYASVSWIIDLTRRFSLPNLLRYLLATNILAARTFLTHFTSLLLSARPTLTSEQIALGDSDEVSITSDVTLNFLQLLIRTCQRAHGPSPEHQREARNAWVRLTGRYQNMGGLVGSPLMRQVYFFKQWLSIARQIIYIHLYRR